MVYGYCITVVCQRKRIRSKPKKPDSSHESSPRQKDRFVHTVEGPVDSDMYAAFTDAASHSPKLDRIGRRLSFPAVCTLHRMEGGGDDFIFQCIILVHMFHLIQWVGYATYSGLLDKLPSTLSTAV